MHRQRNNTKITRHVESSRSCRRRVRESQPRIALLAFHDSSSSDSKYACVYLKKMLLPRKFILLAGSNTTTQIVSKQPMPLAMSTRMSPIAYHNHRHEQLKRVTGISTARLPAQLRTIFACLPFLLAQSRRPGTLQLKSLSSPIPSFPANR